MYEICICGHWHHHYFVSYRLRASFRHYRRSNSRTRDLGPVGRHILMNLPKQCRKVYDFIEAHPGCTTKDIHDGTGIMCPTGRMSEMRRPPHNIVFTILGEKRYPGAKPFKMYALAEKPADQVQMADDAYQPSF